VKKGHRACRSDRTGRQVEAVGKILANGGSPYASVGNCQPCPVFGQVSNGIDALSTTEECFRFIESLRDTRNDVARECTAKRINEAICSENGDAEAQNIDEAHLCEYDGERKSMTGS